MAPGRSAASGVGTAVSPTALAVHVGRHRPDNGGTWGGRGRLDARTHDPCSGDSARRDHNVEPDGGAERDDGAGLDNEPRPERDDSTGLDDEPHPEHVGVRAVIECPLAPLQPRAEAQAYRDRQPLGVRLMKTMAWKVIDRLFVVVYGESDPTDDEWVSFLKDIERHGIDRTMHLTVTTGGGPNETQRRYLNELLDGRPVPVAVLTNSTAIRGMITALSLFNRKIAAFPPNGLRDALAFLEIPARRTELIEHTIQELRGKLGPREAPAA